MWEKSQVYKITTKSGSLVLLWAENEQSWGAALASGASGPSAIGTARRTPWHALEALATKLDEERLYSESAEVRLLDPPAEWLLDEPAQRTDSGDHIASLKKRARKG